MRKHPRPKAQRRLRAQYEAQRDRARMLRDFMGKHGHYLVVVRYPNVEPRVSIVGNSITEAAVEHWRREGARVRRIGGVW